jgi:hypothetical protein
MSLSFNSVKASPCYRQGFKKHQYKCHMLNGATEVFIEFNPKTKVRCMYAASTINGRKRKVIDIESNEAAVTMFRFLRYISSAKY